jgi:hypothetical protein
MSDPTQRTADIETPDAEVELSAQDLLDLASPCKSNEPASGSPTLPQAPAPNKPVSRRYSSLAIAIVAVGALYVAVSPSDTPSQSQNIQQPQSQLPASAPKAESKSVLFANPFDANEVFEFPAGTSEVEARDAVAEILMARAMERQRQFDARVSNNR